MVPRRFLFHFQESCDPLLSIQEVLTLGLSVKFSKSVQWLKRRKIVPLNLLFI